MELDVLYKEDSPLLNEHFQEKEAIFSKSAHPTYRARWEAASLLREKAMFLPDREREDSWKSLMANWVFGDVNLHASECADRPLFALKI